VLFVKTALQRFFRRRSFRLLRSAVNSCSRKCREGAYGCRQWACGGEQGSGAAIYGEFGKEFLMHGIVIVAGLLTFAATAVLWTKATIVSKGDFK